MLYSKNLLFALSLLGTHSLVHCYSISIKNTTVDPVKITMVYAGGSIICPNVELEVKAGETRQVESGACCTSYITMYGLKGTVEGKSFTYEPPVTGFGIACRGFSFLIKKTEDGKELVGVSY